MLPVFEKDKATIAARVNEFRALDTQAKHRQMESGILLLLRVMLSVFAEKLQIPAAEVAEYVLNNQDAWEKAAAGDDDSSKWVVAAANELDNAIFSTVTDLGCSVEEIAAKLDEALRNSFWQKRVQTLEADEQAAQTALLKSRASWLWNATTAEKRRGFFSAGIGFSAGDLIVNNSQTLGQLLAVGEVAIGTGDSATASAAAIEIARQLLGVYPFACDLPERWEDVVRGWLSGEPTASFATADEIAFIQDGLVYRLVWAVESIRTTLTAIGKLPTEAEGGNFALCITYGAPNIPAAFIQQAGLSSRRLAVQLVEQLGLSFTNNNGLKFWLQEVANDSVQPVIDPVDQPEWDRFVVDVKRSSAERWQERQGNLPAVWDGVPPARGAFVRVRNDPTGQRIEVFSPNLDLLGHVPGHTLWPRGKYFCRVSDDGQNIELSHFGP